jgi:hypothetical protein
MCSSNKDLIKYCIRHMSSKELIHKLYTDNTIKYAKSDSYKKLAERIDDEKSPELDLEKFIQFFRVKWIPSPIDLHLKNLKSGSLQGHDWHGAMPSMLHLSMQGKVRDCINGKINLEELINIGSDIMKHEYFIVATHDLLETSIIETFDEVIPSIGKKSISDFVFKGIPYDLKNTNYFNNWTRESVNRAKKKVAEDLIKGADIARIRKQAEGSINGWGLNRFYVMVEDQDLWFKEPEVILKMVLNEIKKLGEPFDIKIEDGITFKAQVVAI